MSAPYTRTTLRLAPRAATPVMAPLEEAEPTGSVRPAAPDSPRHSALAPDSPSCPLDSALPPLLAVPVGVVDVAGDAAGRQHRHLILHAGHGSTAQLAGGGAPLLASAPPRAHARAHTRARLPGCGRCREGAGRAPAGAERGWTGNGLARRSGRVSAWPCWRGDARVGPVGGQGWDRCRAVRLCHGPTYCPTPPTAYCATPP